MAGQSASQPCMFDGGGVMGTKKKTKTEKMQKRLNANICVTIDFDNRPFDENKSTLCICFDGDLFKHSMAMFHWC